MADSIQLQLGTYWAYYDMICIKFRDCKSPDIPTGSADIWLYLAVDIYVARACYDGSPDAEDGFDGTPPTSSTSNKTSIDIVAYR